MMSATCPELEQLNVLHQAGLLNSVEHDALVTQFRELAVRRRVDKLDAGWQRSLAQYSTKSVKSTNAHLPSSIDAIVFALLGFSLWTVTVYALVRSLVQRTGDMESNLGTWLAVGGAIAGGYLLMSSRKSYKVAKDYDSLRRKCLREREVLWDEIAQEHRPKVRFCSNCLRRWS